MVNYNDPYEVCFFCQNGESKRLKTIGLSAGVYNSLGLASS